MSDGQPENDVSKLAIVCVDALEHFPGGVRECAGISAGSNACGDEGTVASDVEVSS